MRRLAVPVLAVSAAAFLPGLTGRAMELLADVETFRVRGVAVEGLRHISRGEVDALLTLPADASVWDDAGPWERAVEAHPVVRSVEIARRLPSTLVVRVEERTPVAFLATPTLEPVDADGRSVPVDPTVHPMDLPLLSVPTPDPGRPGGGARTPSIEAAPDAAGAGGRSRARAVGTLAREIARLREEDPAFASGLSQLAWSRGEVIARWGDPAVDLHFRPPLSGGLVRRALAVLSDASARHPDRAVASIDLRWAEQVVVRYADGGRS